MTWLELALDEFPRGSNILRLPCTCSKVRVFYFSGGWDLPATEMSPSHYMLIGDRIVLRVDSWPKDALAPWVEYLPAERTRR